LEVRWDQMLRPPAIWAALTDVFIQCFAAPTGRVTCLVLPSEYLCWLVFMLLCLRVLADQPLVPLRRLPRACAEQH
jgi:hypothetical protein